MRGIVALNNIITVLFRPKAVERILSLTCSDIITNPTLCPAAAIPREKKLIANIQKESDENIINSMDINPKTDARIKTGFRLLIVSETKPRKGQPNAYPIHAIDIRYAAFVCEKPKTCR